MTTFVDLELLDGERVEAPTNGHAEALGWPRPPAPAAFTGLAGEVVRAIDPYTEADPVAILAQFLAAFGTAVGPGPRFAVGASDHRANLFVAIVGKSAKARKGTSWSPVHRLLAGADDGFRHRIQAGISSGEGLIHAVRDQVVVEEEDKDGNRSRRIVDYGVDDKRLFVSEGELGRVLATMQRQGNTLGAVLRCAWDTGDLAVLTKTATRATGAHIGIAGHITAAELRTKLAADDVSNGFANRFLWVPARRSKELPHPAHFDERPLAEEVARVLTWARQPRSLERDAHARSLWTDIYHDLSLERPESRIASAIARSEAQVVRLSLIYALLARSECVTLEHLRAGLALWDYCERGAAYVFRESIDPRAARIIDALNRRGRLTGSDLGALFNRNVPADQLLAIVESLVRQGLVLASLERTPGRSRRVYLPAFGGRVHEAAERDVESVD